MLGRKARGGGREGVFWERGEAGVFWGRGGEEGGNWRMKKGKGDEGEVVRGEEEGGEGKEGWGQVCVWKGEGEGENEVYWRGKGTGVCCEP